MDYKAALMDEIPSSKFKLRFDLPYVPISHFAKQFYCEQQLDYEYTHGKTLTEKEIEGTIIHEEVFSSEEVNLEQLIEYIDNTAFCMCTFPVYFEINEVLFGGSPDK
jgi:hypothetical protein